MTDQELQRKLNRLVKLANELVDEAQRRYGPDGNLFFESGGAFNIMDGDAPEEEGAAARQAHIRFSSQKYCKMDAGVW